MPNVLCVCYCILYSGRLALQRLNALHGRYAISNDDNLYTLGLFFLEPDRHTRESDWRCLTAHEKEAMYNYWYDVGTRMNIRDMPQSFDEWKQFNDAYEDKHMVYDERNVLVAEPLVKLFDRLALPSSCACAEYIRLGCAK